MKKILNLTELTSSGKKVARLSGNRDLDEKIISSKKESLKKYGLLVPAIIVDARKAFEENLEMIDFESNEIVNEEQLEHYVIILDANHRFKAHLELLKEGDYNKEFYFVDTLNTDVEIPIILAEINVCTNPWKGKDYGKGAEMMVNQKLELLEEINTLTSEGYSLDAASKWLTFRNQISKKVLTDAMNGKIAECLTKTSGIKRGLELIKAAKTSLSSDLLKTRTLIDWIINKYDSFSDVNKEKDLENMKLFLSSIKREDAEKIEKSKGKRGECTKEELVYKKINSLYESFLIEMATTKS